MGRGPVEWVGVSGCDVTRPKWPKNNILFSSTFFHLASFGQVPNFNLMALSSDITYRI